MRVAFQFLKQKTLLLQKYLQGQKTSALLEDLHDALALTDDQLGQMKLLFDRLCRQYRQIVNDYVQRYGDQKTLVMFAAEHGYHQLLKETLASPNVQVNYVHMDYSYDADDDGLLFFCGDESGFTALMLAVKYGGLISAELLIRANANLQLRNANGHSALDLAKRYQNKLMVELLERAPLLQAEEIYWKLQYCKIEEVDGIIATQQSLGIPKSMVVDQLLQVRPTQTHYRSLLLRLALACNAEGQPLNALSYYLSAPQSIFGLSKRDDASIAQVRAALIALDMESTPDYTRPRGAILGSFNRPVCYAYARVVDPSEHSENELINKESLASRFAV